MQILMFSHTSCNLTDQKKKHEAAKLLHLVATVSDTAQINYTTRWGFLCPYQWSRAYCLCLSLCMSACKSVHKTSTFYSTFNWQGTVFMFDIGIINSLWIKDLWSYRWHCDIAVSMHFKNTSCYHCITTTFVELNFVFTYQSKRQQNIVWQIVCLWVL